MNPNTPPQPLLDRSTLIVPLSSERFIAKAHLRGADSIMLDLEDGVAPNAKAAARERLASAVKEVSRSGARVKVRINRPLDMVVRDIEAAVIPGVSVLHIAKVESPSHVHLLADLVAKLEAERGLAAMSVTLAASLETPGAFRQVYEIAAAHPRLTTIGLGPEDFSAECGFDPTPEALFYPKQVTLFAAKAAGIMASGYMGSIADFTDLEAFRAVIRRSRKLGYRGGACIHPDQVAVLNEEFAPSAQEVIDAQAIVDEARAQFAKGVGAFPYKGKMIDMPVVNRALEIVQVAAAIVAQAAHAQRTRVLLGK